MVQKERDAIMAFRGGMSYASTLFDSLSVYHLHSRVLITSDVWARGIDVQQVSLVINYDLPDKLHLASSKRPGMSSGLHPIPSINFPPLSTTYSRSQGPPPHCPYPAPRPRSLPFNPLTADNFLSFPQCVVEQKKQDALYQPPPPPHLLSIPHSGFNATVN